MESGDMSAGHEMIVRIIGEKPKYRPYVAIYVSGITKTTQATGWIADKHLELFAVNILKAIKSKKPKP